MNKIDVEQVRCHYSRDRVTIVWSLWRHQENVDRASDGVYVWRSSFLSSFMDSLCRVRNRIIYVLSWWIFFHSLDSPRGFSTREVNTKITLSWAQKQFATRVHTLFSIYPYQGLYLSGTSCVYTDMFLTKPSCFAQPPCGSIKSADYKIIYFGVGGTYNMFCGILKLFKMMWNRFLTKQ